MNVVDSSGWLEYFADGPNADIFAPIIEDIETLVTPTVSIYEVFKRVLQQRNEHEALQAVAVMLRTTVVELDTQLALAAARISAQLQIPMADSFILATARTHSATLWTQDAHFASIQGVRYIPAQSRR
ncbi:MAG: type II toxin-antitoxin system VapC family toxin [Caldilinea sp.]